MPGAALLLAAVVAGGAAGGVVGRITGDDRVAVTSSRGGSGTGTLATGDIHGVLDRTEPSVVAVRTESFQRGRFFPARGAGSGTILTADGEVLTNAHVVEGAGSIEVFLNGDEDGKPADLVGMDRANDVALLKIRNASGLPTATLGTSGDLRVGDSVVALGNALNLGATATVTQGIVSALNRSIEAPGVDLERLIQSDAAINPGNSGGPLVDAQGRVVGVNTAVAGDAQNIGFALAIDTVKPIIERLRSGGGGTTQRAFLGVTLTDAEGGAGVAAVAPGSPAAAAGLRAGDVITKLGDTDIDSTVDLVNAVRAKKVGDEVTITWTRAGRTMTGTAKLVAG
jgi:putative serine protease PepD